MLAYDIFRGIIQLSCHNSYHILISLLLVLFFGNYAGNS